MLSNGQELWAMYLTKAGSEEKVCWYSMAKSIMPAIRPTSSVDGYELSMNNEV
jgi:hypothetical protein